MEGQLESALQSYFACCDCHALKHYCCCPHQEPIDIHAGLSEEVVQRMAKNLGFTGEKQAQVTCHNILNDYETQNGHNRFILGPYTQVCL